MQNVLKEVWVVSCPGKLVHKKLQAQLSDKSIARATADLQNAQSHDPGLRKFLNN